DFKIGIEDNLLTISFEHKEENREQTGKENWVRNEYLQSSFTRSFTLDETVDANKINATYKDGILHLVLPKNEKSKKLSRTVEIK
ncbi:MAG TPA: Hsp20/alpha crystallin family protein, partial [Chitinophagaceae bacterium]|nr:Hsp20/alpha crystallin family protein [Chitinophagaceae bacterium]